MSWVPDAVIGADPNAANWNADADLDGDLVVGLFDYLILSDNFDKEGDNF